MNWNIIHLPETDSTNEYAKTHLNNIPLPAFIYADYQTKGKGQQNNTWYSEPNKNLLCSIALPIHISAEKNNYISQWISVILVELLIKAKIPPHLIKIKWPNDIIIQTNDGYKKIAGILIENIIEKTHLTHSIIGVGLNINQTGFLQLHKTATSIQLITHQNYEIDNLINTFVQIINEFLPLITLQQFQIIHQLYLQHLYGWQTEFLFKDKNQILKGKITHLSDDGKITVSVDNNARTYSNKQIQFIL